MANVVKVEVLAIYEDSAVPSGARITNRDNDVALATSQAAARQHYTPGGQPVNVGEEYITPFGGGAPSSGRGFERYGTLGWVATQWLVVPSDGDAVGQALATRLNSRTLKPGSKVQVFPVTRDTTDDPYTTGGVTFQQSWPPQPTDTL